MWGAASVDALRVAWDMVAPKSGAALGAKWSAVVAPSQSAAAIRRHVLPWYLRAARNLVLVFVLL